MVPDLKLGVFLFLDSESFIWASILTTSVHFWLLNHSWFFRNTDFKNKDFK